MFLDTKKGVRGLKLFPSITFSRNRDRRVDLLVCTLAVIGGQGIALGNDLGQSELDSGVLCYLSDVALDDAGCCLVYTAPAAARDTMLATFVDWISQQH